MYFSDAVGEALKKGKIALIPTDTLYGIVCSAYSPEAVERLYRIRGRDEGKPCILLLSERAVLEEFGISLGEVEEEKLDTIWSGKVSVVFDCPDTRWAYLHRGTKTLAFRVPESAPLRELLGKTGPLLAPSANRQGESPAETLDEALKVFGDAIDISVDGGRLVSEPSTVANLKNGEWNVLRPGAVKL